MAKMFYTTEEVCQRLGKSSEEIKAMVESGQIQEFRNGEDLVFKVEQIDLLAGSEDSGDIELDLSDDQGANLEGSSELSGLNLDASSLLGSSSMMDISGSETGMDQPPTSPPDAEGITAGSGVAFDLSGSATGISAFGGDVDAGETRLGEEFDDDLTLESVGSGSGLLDLTRESDDTSLGAELLEDVYSSDDEFELPSNATGLFDAQSEGASATPVAAPSTAVPTMAVAEEAYDGAGSGLSVGLLIGALCAMIALLFILASEFQGVTSALTEAIAGNLWIWTGGLLAGAIVAGGIGLFVGRSSQ